MNTLWHSLWAPGYRFTHTDFEIPSKKLPARNVWVYRCQMCIYKELYLTLPAFGLTFLPTFLQRSGSALAEVTNVSLMSVTPVTDSAQLVTPMPLCRGHTPKHILEIYFFFQIYLQRKFGFYFLFCLLFK